MSQNLVFYTLATATTQSPCIIDSVFTRDDGTHVGAYSDLTVQALAEKHGCEILIGNSATVHKLIEASYITPPETVSEENFHYALNCLPPMRWGRWVGVESCRMSEFYTGNITTIYARTPDGRHWRFRDDADMSGDAVALKVLAMAKKTAN